MSDTLTETRESVSLDVPWTVIVYDDPVNLIEYVIYVFKKVFGYAEPYATRLTMEVHNQGRSLVWTGEKEKAEFYTQQLQSLQLRASMEKAE